MKVLKKLNIRGSLLDKTQLAVHIEKVASEHAISQTSNKITYPIPRLIEDYRFIVETYNLLTNHLKLGIKIHSAGEWILDNFYIICFRSYLFCRRERSVHIALDGLASLPKVKLHWQLLH
mgnify:CR=1 FL=1